jgi:hypothetical protein
MTSSFFRFGKRRKQEAQITGFFFQFNFVQFFFCRGGSGDAETGQTATRENKSAASVSRSAAARESAGR